jgi:hypothetical protein
MGSAKWGSRVLDFWRLLNPGPHSPSTTVDGGLVHRRRGSAIGVVVTPSARETLTPRELTAAYKIFKERGPQYLDTETGIRAAAYRFDERELLVYEESETRLVVLIHPSDPWPGRATPKP